MLIFYLFYNSFRFQASLENGKNYGHTCHSKVKKWTFAKVHVSRLLRELGGVS